MADPIFPTVPAAPTQALNSTNWQIWQTYVMAVSTYNLAVQVEDRRTQSAAEIKGMRDPVPFTKEEVTLELLKHFPGMTGVASKAVVDLCAKQADDFQAKFPPPAGG